MTTLGRPKTNIGGRKISGYADPKLDTIIDQEIERIKQQTGLTVGRWQALQAIVFRAVADKT